MKKFIALGAFLFSSAVFSAGFVVDPYVGVEGTMRNLSYANNFGRGDLAKHMPQLGAFAGLKFGNNFGLEVAAHAGKSKTHAVSRVKTKMRGLSLSALVFLPLMNTGLELFGGPGLTHLNQVFKHVGDDTYRLDSTKLVMRGIAGVQYYLTDNLGARAAVSLENTNRLKVVDQGDALVKPKNSYNAHLGLLYKF